MSTYSDLFNETSFQGDSIIVNTLQVNTSALFGYMSNSLVGVDATGALIAMPLTAGQLFYGRTGLTPLAVVLASTNGVTATLVGSTLNINTPRDIRKSANPTWAGVLITPGGASASLILTTTGGGSSLTHVDGVGCTLRDTSGGGLIRVTTGVQCNVNILDNGTCLMTVGQLIDSCLL